METMPQTKQKHTDEIDLVELFRHLWNGRILILKITGIFIFFALLVAIASPKQYRADARLLPEVKGSVGGASALLRQFGGIGGFNLPMGENGDALSPMLYPDVLRSTPFFLELLEFKISINEGDEKNNLSVYEYLIESNKGSFIRFFQKYTIELPGTILSLFRNEAEEASIASLNLQESIKIITTKQEEIINYLRKRIFASIDQKNGVISISAEFGNPYVAAQIADFAVNYLANYITEYRIEKAKNEFLFMQERYNEKEREYILSQKELAVFRDTNRNVQLATIKNEEEILNNKHNLAFNVFTGIAQQLEQARLKVQEHTPVIKVLEPVTVPIEKSKPKRAFILLMGAFSGVFTGAVVIFGLLIWKGIQNKYE